MNEDTAVATPKSRRRIIERPRLTRMLDASPVRVRTLIAPAGYGKTTLARQWTGTPERPAVWYVGGPASADVAALAAGIAKTGSELLPGCDKRIRQRLSVTKRPEDEVDVLAEIVSEDLAGWPEGTWLVLDEYQFAAESPPADEFMGRVVDATSMPILIASRTRPGWATARKILYGEILELGRSALAMNDEEAHEALGARGEEAPGLVALADGWPAVIGLAAASDEPLPEDMPAALYDFFAEELYQGFDRSVREGLWKLSLLASFDPSFAQVLLGDDAEVILDQAFTHGIISRSRNDALELHPLLREFLQRKLRSQPLDRTEAIARDVARVLLDYALWDEAFAVGTHLGVTAVVEDVISAGLDEALNAGRSASLRQWLEYATGKGLSAPLLDVAAAELALRDGRYFQAEILAANAASSATGLDARVATRAFCVAGRAAHLASHEERALELFREAKDCAVTDAEQTTAALGEASCALDLELDESADLVEALARRTRDDPVGRLQLAGKRLTLEQRFGRVGNVSEALAVAEIAERAADPLVRASFWNVLAHTLALAAQYEESREFAERMLDDARVHRLRFVIPYGYATVGMCHAGKSEFEAAEQSLVSAIADAKRNRDGYGAWNARAILARTLVARGDPESALREIRGQATGVTKSLAMEVRTSRGLAEACCGSFNEALDCASAAEATTRAVEPRVLAACIRAIVSLSRGEPRARDDSRAALAAAVGTGNVDSFVCAYRGCPQLAIALLADVDSSQATVEIMTTAGDEHVASITGGKGAGEGLRGQRLTQRELEVHALLTQGLTNREIAGRLFISEATVKVHIRHVFEKLGVRSRTAAALRSRPPR